MVDKMNKYPYWYSRLLSKDVSDEDAEWML